jgi:hypothetical protein
VDSDEWEKRLDLRAGTTAGASTEFLGRRIAPETPHFDG